MKDKNRFPVTKETLIQTAERLCFESQMRFVFLFASDERGGRGSFVIRYVFSGPEKNEPRTTASQQGLSVVRGEFAVLELDVREKEPSFPSITALFPGADWQEREVQDLFGLTAEGHPDPRRLVLHEDWPEGVYPLRKDFDASRPVGRVKGEYLFEHVDGEGVFEIPVGPVHAGIIEPGHFRFSSAGESILKLEIRHFYTHKGLEKLGEGKSPAHLLCLAERISGDNSLAHAAACAQALEALCGIQVPPRAQYLRLVFLELERLYNHIGDVAGIVLDVAFEFGAAQLTRIRERLLRLNERLTGSRLLRSAIRVGGVRRDLIEAQREFLLKELASLETEFNQVIQILWQIGSFVDRIEETGIIHKEVAETLGGTGPVARASGINRDLRRDHAYGAYDHVLVHVPVFSKGDVETRMRVKIQEFFESIRLIREAVKTLPDDPCILADAKPLPADKTALGYVESPRGACFHWIATDSRKKISRWKIQSPSFSNWPLIQYAVLENIVPDFPVINKSMNLSYSGNDR